MRRSVETSVPDEPDPVLLYVPWLRPYGNRAVWP
jgi:hypothetical protein